MISSQHRLNRYWCVKLGMIGALVGSLIVGSCRTRSSDLSATTPATDQTFRGKGSFNIWDYDPGPLNQQLTDLFADIPYFPGLSKAIYGDQFFRPAFGPIPWRMMPEPNSVKILFIGQDGTHIAEAAGRPATAGFGGRAQDLAEYFGVSSGAAFMNAYAFTIKWQYGVFDAPVISGKPGAQKLQLSSFTPNQVWLMSQDQDSRIVQWRNDLIEYIINNNRKSLQMIVLFGGAARDTMGAFVESRGGRVDGRYTPADIKKFGIKVAEFGLVPAGGNKQASVLLDKTNKPMYKPESAQQFVKQFNDAGGKGFVDKIAFSKGGAPGLEETGLVHPAQLGGYDINRKMFIGGGSKPTISIKGLKLKNGWSIDHDVVVTQLPHPTALSMMPVDEADCEKKNVPADKCETASEAVAKGLAGLRAEFPKFAIKPDPFFKATYPKDYVYGRGDMGPEFYDFGAPKSRMVNVSTASRQGKMGDVIVFGTREKARFNSKLITAMQEAQPEFDYAKKAPYKNELWIAKPNSERRNEYDPGPPQPVAEALKKALMTKDKAFLKAREVNGDYAHYRGTWKNPAVVVIADPFGEDDLITARALTGARGQYLHSLIRNIKAGSGTVGDNYLVVKTVPYSAQATNPAIWDESVKGTQAYRKAAFDLVAKMKPQVIILDGEIAESDFNAMQPDLAKKAVVIKRSGSCTEAYDKLFGCPASGIDAAAKQLKAKFDGVMADIPRTHMSFYARTWEGTSGDRVITSEDSFKGTAFAEVAPAWAYNQKVALKGADLASCNALRSKLVNFNLRMTVKESVSDYLKRANNNSVENFCGGRLASNNDGDGAPMTASGEPDWLQDGHTMIMDQDGNRQQYEAPEVEGAELQLE